ncbi:hypothetical protein RND81_12G177500 [Saponaria officinalis]|uniref:FBD domain-containing protein n=1 Tax=Saponaria officinalis TaxID=3572 RepID=A0AAW1HC37_SAPOF
MNLCGKKNMGIHDSVHVPNLRHLEFQVRARFNQSLRGWASLIAASPKLQKLSLKLCGRPTHADWILSKWVGFPLKCLTTLELAGYVGPTLDLELAIFVFENATMLQEVIVDFVPLYNKHGYHTGDKQENLAKLRMKLPQAVNLTIK